MGTWNANQDSMDYQRATSTLNNNKSATKALILPTETVQNILYKLPLSIFSVVTVSLPLGSLVFCFITACIFQHELVTETECHVSHKIQSSLIGSASCCLVAMCSPITIHVTLVLVHWKHKREISIWKKKLADSFLIVGRKGFLNEGTFFGLSRLTLLFEEIEIPCVLCVYIRIKHCNSWRTVDILALWMSMTNKFCFWTSWFPIDLPEWTSWNFIKISEIPKDFPTCYQFWSLASWFSSRRTVARWRRKAWCLDTRGFIPKKIQWHIHTGPWSLVNWWREALMRHYIRASWILMRVAVGFEDWPQPW